MRKFYNSSCERCLDMLAIHWANEKIRKVSFVVLTETVL